MSAAEPTLTFATATASTGAKNIDFAVTSNSIVMAAASSTGNCYYIADVETANSSLVTGKITGAGTWYAAAASPVTGGCLASAPAANWQTNGFPSV